MWRRPPSPRLYFSHLEACPKRFVNKVADLIARKKKERYCDVVRHVRTRIRFAMLRSSLIALRGYRGKNMDKIMRHLYQNSLTTSSLPL